MLPTAALLLFTIPAALLAQEFEAVSIRPNNSPAADTSMNIDGGLLRGTNQTLKAMIVRAWLLKDYQVQGPSWIGTEHFDIQARFPDNMPKDDDRFVVAATTMLKKMLADRFHLVTHQEEKMFTVYALTVAKPGIRFSEVPRQRSSSHGGAGFYEGKSVDMGAFTKFLSRNTDLPVVDKTGLTGFYDINLRFLPDTVRESLEDQLGLKLETTKAPISVLVVDSADKTPTGN